MAIGNAGVAIPSARTAHSTNGFKTFLSRYFYFFMALAMAVLVTMGFRRTVDASLFHASPPRPLLLWIHGAAFSLWMVFYISQSTLVRVRRVSVHRSLGWFGAGLAAVMVPLGLITSVMMTRFDLAVLHQPQDVGAFMAVPFADMIIFGACAGLAIYWRKTPDLHRRLLFIATCELMDAGIGRFDFWFNHSIFYVAVDLLIVLGMTRDWVVDGRIHKVYLYALPPIIAIQSVAVYAWRVNPGWWRAVTHAILG